MEKEDVKLLQYKQKAAGKRWRNIEKQPGLALCYNVFIENVDCRSEGNILGGGTEKKGDDHFCKMDYNTIIKWGITFLRKAGAMSRMTLSEKIAIRQRL